MDDSNNRRCILTGRLIYFMDECPIWQYEARDECHSDCAYYTKFKIPTINNLLSKPKVIEHPFGDDEII